MKKLPILSFVFFMLLVLAACESTPAASKEKSTPSSSSSKGRQLSLGEYSVSELDFGGVERWYVVDKYNYDSKSDEVRFQVGYFKENNIGFVLYGSGTAGELANFSRQGLDLRWDWGETETSYKYTFVIEPDGTGLYYDFSSSTDGKSKPRGIYKASKF